MESLNDQDLAGGKKKVAEMRYPMMLMVIMP
jgi:hypothetical protein